MRLIISTIFLLELIFLVSSQPHLLWPIPSNYSYGSTNITISNPCSFNFVVTSGNENGQMNELFNQYINLIFPKNICKKHEANIKIVMENQYKDSNNCHQAGNFNTLYVNVSDTSNIMMNFEADESYYLILDDKSFNLTAKTYLGFVRGLETFSQIVKIDYYNNDYTWTIPFTPINIYDFPRFPHRGLMLDTSRHFASKKEIFTILNGMMYSKLNIFHWHITDSDSFPIYIPSHPNLTKYGAYDPDRVYTQKDVLEIVEYAITRAIRIIPELDSPAHSRSWSLSPEFSDLFTCTNPDPGMGTPLGQIDPTMNETYQRIGDILNDLQDYFPDEFIHLGADEIETYCWEEKPSIQAWMSENNISNYEELFNYYINEERQLLQDNRTAIYWINPSTNYLQFKETDVLQYWGESTAMQSLLDNYPNNRFILSAYDYLYLDCGMGNYFGGDSWCDPYKTWDTIYSFEPTELLNQQSMNQIIGAETTMWAELVNTYTMDKIFPRASALAERLWSPLQNNYNGILSIATRLNQFHWNLEARGIPSAPITSGYCERNLYVCFMD